MKIPKLVIDNFLAIGHIEVSLSEKGLVLVQGENLDDSSQNSNGSGKSSFPDALCWCLYGETARGESGDAVVNRTAGKNCRVSTIIEDGGEKYAITRHRKHSTEKNRLTVFRVSDGSDMTKGTDKATQEVVTRLIGCSLPVFVSAIYAGQEAIPDLPRMTDKELKSLVEEASGTTRLQRAYEIANAKLNKVKVEIERAGIKVASEMARIEDLRETYDNVSTQSAIWATSRVDRIKDAVAIAKDIKVEYDNLAIQKIQPDKPKCLAELDEANRALSLIAASQQRLADLQKEENKASLDFQVLENDIRAGKETAKRAKVSLDNIHAKVGCPCGECGKAYEEADLKDAKRIADENLRKQVAYIKQQQSTLELRREALGKAQQATADFKSSMTSTTEWVQRRDAANHGLEVIRKHQERVDACHEKYKNAVIKVKELKDEANPHTQTMVDIAVKIEAIRKALEGALRDKDALIKESEAIADAAKVFSPAGVRAYILDTVTPFLNDRTAHYLSILSDGNLTAQWSTLNKLKSGEIREKFAIAVSSLTGGESFGLISGGEKRKVRLACSMALQDLVASRASKPFDLYIADEIDDAVDASGLERLMSILESKARERGTVLVISHNSLSDWIRESVKVVKSGGFAKIDGDALEP